MTEADAEVKPKPLFAMATGALYVVGLGAAMTVLEQLLGTSPMAGVLAGAVVAEMVVSRLGMRWRDGLDKVDAAAIARLVGKGAAPIALAFVAILVVARVAGVADVAVGAPSAALAFALVRAVALGVRDELFFRGLPFLVVERAGGPRFAAIAFGACAGAATLVLAPGATPMAIALEIASGLAFAMLWSWGPLAAVAAHAAWALLLGAGIHGSILDVSFTGGALTLGAHASGAPAAIAAAASLGVAAYAALRTKGRAPSKASS